LNIYILFIHLKYIIFLITHKFFKLKINYLFITNFEIFNKYLSFCISENIVTDIINDCIDLINDYKSIINEKIKSKFLIQVIRIIQYLFLY